jgi:hypothetical protein
MVAYTLLCWGLIFRYIGGSFFREDSHSPRLWHLAAYHLFD